MEERRDQPVLHVIRIALKVSGQFFLGKGLPPAEPERDLLKLRRGGFLGECRNECLQVLREVPRFAGELPGFGRQVPRFEGELPRFGREVHGFRDGANDTAGRDLKELVGLDLIQPQGSGRSAHYVWQPAGIDRRFGGIG